MIGLELLLSHLVGDYLIQNDWMAKNKTNPLCGPIRHTASCDGTVEGAKTCQAEILAQLKSESIGHLACTVHCLLYTLAVWFFTHTWMPWWGLFICFLAHWPIDRFRLAAWWMKHVSGQAFFASRDHPMFPWSIVVVDNIFHLLTLYWIARLVL